ncbi:GNAT family N-acetyltransferase [Georgenia satyanarayanai]|uniref:GNAT family N-acetyltransferase n=1 Tax=Georgenia satyanarayanai TaxID=860221 RepID=UPI002041CD49|nr:GNAT family N-acetyltransferase [Georgenia satyanarayanai]MCM3661746.1 GNAT family N-acetyltransferase [Georgenia satyanarayanai]
MRLAGPDDAVALAALAALTFPLACPPSLGPEAIAAHVATRLDADNFARFLTDPAHLVHVAADEDTGALLGYTMVVLDSPAPGREESEGVAELSKCYVHPDVHGRGLAGRLVAAATDAAAERGARELWLGTNAANRRARRFYERCGFAVVGKRTYDVGGVPNDDVVMSTPVSVP